MSPSEFIKCIKSPSFLNEEYVPILLEMVNRFPYCSTLRFLLAKYFKKNDLENMDQFIQNTALYMYDRRQFYYKLHNIKVDDNFQNHTSLYSIEVIENQINKNNEGMRTITDNLINKELKIRLNLAKDDVILDDEILSNDKNEDEFISETLAELYSRQGNYNKTISIYEKLSLKNPEKNIYFASLIEKIKKESLK